jgi:hypothetical protein
LKNASGKRISGNNNGLICNMKKGAVIWAGRATCHPLTSSAASDSLWGVLLLNVSHLWCCREVLLDKSTAFDGFIIII